MQNVLILLEACVGVRIKGNLCVQITHHLFLLLSAGLVCIILSGSIRSDAPSTGVSRFFPIDCVEPNLVFHVSNRLARGHLDCL